MKSISCVKSWTKIDGRQGQDDLNCIDFIQNGRQSDKLFENTREYLYMFEAIKYLFSISIIVTKNLAHEINSK